MVTYGVTGNSNSHFHTPLFPGGGGARKKPLFGGGGGGAQKTAISRAGRARACKKASFLGGGGGRTKNNVGLQVFFFGICPVLSCCC